MNSNVLKYYTSFRHGIKRAQMIHTTKRKFAIQNNSRHFWNKYTGFGFGVLATFSGGLILYFYLKPNFKDDAIQTHYTEEGNLEAFNLTDLTREISYLLEYTRVLLGIPGLIYEVRIGGKTITSVGLGYCDVESLSPCYPEKSRFRIASISKSITGLLALSLASEKKIDLDCSIYKYWPEFPKKEVNGRVVEITLRQLLNHTSGIRHYEKAGFSEKEQKEASDAEKIRHDKFESIEKSVEVFTDDPLLCEPGTEFHYSSYGYTLASAVIEKATGEPFSQSIQNYLTQLNLTNTIAEPGPGKLETVFGRMPGYARDNKAKLELIPVVNNEHKVAAGGLMSTLSDLCTLGEKVSKAFGGKQKFPFVDNELLQQVICPPENPISDIPGKIGFYSLGWRVIKERSDVLPQGSIVVMHTGSAIGTSSVLAVCAPHGNWDCPVVIAMAGNVSGVSLGQAALQVIRKIIVAI